jgi:hypothetical protein
MAMERAATASALRRGRDRTGAPRHPRGRAPIPGAVVAPPDERTDESRAVVPDRPAVGRPGGVHERRVPEASAVGLERRTRNREARLGARDSEGVGMVRECVDTDGNAWTES